MPVHNAEIAELFNRLADLLELEDANPFRVRAYRTAARSINGLAQSLVDLLAAGEDLSKLPGIGKDLAGKIRTLIETGKLPLLEQVQARTPAALSELMKIEGLGPKRVKALHQQLHISSFEDLQRAARSGKIRALAGFGAKTEALILERLEHSRPTLQKRRGDHQRKIVQAVEHDRKDPGQEQEVQPSLRMEQGVGREVSPSRQ